MPLKIATSYDDGREPHPVRAYRMRHNLTLARIAERAGITESGLSRIERANTEFPVASAILALSRACDREVSEFDIFRYHMAAAFGVVPQLEAPMTGDFAWDWVRRRRKT